MSITRRQIFENLTLVRGRELASLFELEGLSGLSKDAFMNTLSRKRSLAPETVLPGVFDGGSPGNSSRAKA